MKKETTEAVDTQGVELTKKENRTIQISLKTLEELSNDGKLRNTFIDTLERNPNMKAPIAYQFAKAILNQEKEQNAE
jgi:hypothetical protein